MSSGCASSRKPLTRSGVLVAASAALWMLAAGLVTSAPAGSQSAPYRWTLPPGFPEPFVPPDNPMSVDKVSLGRVLFYDTRLSGNGTQACATCHRQSLAFTDGRAVSIGSTGSRHPRGSMSLANVAYAATLTWANPRRDDLEDQALVPMFGDHPIELGLSTDDSWLGALRADSKYDVRFRAAFPSDDEPITRTNVVRAIASFERTMISGRSPYDRYHFDRDDSAISVAARRGEVLFHSQPLSCFTCHGGFNFSAATRSASRPAPAVEFHNTGLYNVPGATSYPSTNTGVFEFTGQPSDVGRFKAPTLRNIAVTAPYMHDGSIGTLAEVIDHYAAGGRTIRVGPNAGVGHDNVNKSPTVRGFRISAAERDDLIEFLRTLTDDAFLQDPRFSAP